MWRSLFQSLFFDPLALACVRDVPFRKVVPGLLPVMGEPWSIERSMISFDLKLWVCREPISSVTVFIWIRLFFDPFDFRCPRDVTFWKRLFRGSSQEWVNPGASKSQWLTAFWLLQLAFDKFRLWRSLFEFARCSVLLIVHVYVMFRSERGCSEAPPRNGLTLVARAVSD